MGANRHRLTAGRHLGAGRLVRLIQNGYVFSNPCLSGNCDPGPTCPCPPGTECCEPDEGGGGSGGCSGCGSSPAGDIDCCEELYDPDIIIQNSFTSNRFAIGAINQTVPNHAQIYSENRTNLNNAAKNHAPSFVIGSNLMYAHAPIDGIPVHHKLPSLDRNNIKQVMHIPSMSVGTNDLTASLKTHQNAGGIDLQHDEEKIETKTKINDIGTLDPRTDPTITSEGFGDHHNYRQNDEDGTGPCAFLCCEHGDADCNDTSACDCCRNPLVVGNPNCNINLSDCCLHCGYYWDPTNPDPCETGTLCNAGNCPLPCECFGNVCRNPDGTLCGDPPVDCCAGLGCDYPWCTCKTDIGGDCECDCTCSSNEDCDPECCNDGTCGECPPENCCNGGVECGDCDECNSQCECTPILCQSPDPCTVCGCSSETGGKCECNPIDCPACSTCDNNGNCATDCPTGSACDECGSECCVDGVCTIQECGSCEVCQDGTCISCCDLAAKGWGDENIGGKCDGCLCPCTGDGDCDDGECCEGGECSPDNCECDCSDALSMTLINDELVSVKGNYAPRDLVSYIFMQHDLNQGQSGTSTVVGDHDIVMSATYELTIGAVYGRLADTAAVPKTRDTKFNVYRIKKSGFNPTTSTCSTYDGTNNWTGNGTVRNSTDRVATGVSFTIPKEAKPGDKIQVDVTDIARYAATNGGIMDFMIEPAEYYASATSDSPVASSVGKTSMLVEFCQIGDYAPTMKLMLDRNRSPVTSRIHPAILRSRIAAG
jgi:hypothetical protein